jgi:hypothetical protein
MTIGEAQPGGGEHLSLAPFSRAANYRVECSSRYLK